MRAIDDTAVLTNDLALRGNHDTIRIDPKAHRSIGEGRRHAVAIALQMDEAGRCNALGILDKPVKRPGNRHERRCFLSPDVGDGAAHLTVWGLRPQFLAALLQPVV